MSTQIRAAQIAPAGNSGELQFNNAGALSADTNLAYDPGTGELSVGGLVLSRGMLLALFGDGADGVMDAGAGLTKTITGDAFPTSIVWKVTATNKKVAEKLLTWADAFPTTIVWKLYDASEVLLLTITDTISYSGAFETGRTRVVS